jgi:hypothetical protein
LSNWVGIAAIVGTLLVGLMYVWNMNRIRGAEQDIKKIDALKVDVKEFRQEMSELQTFYARLDTVLAEMDGAKRLTLIQVAQAKQGEQLNALVKWTEQHDRVGVS